jgi:hypothetical protein
VEDPDRPAPSSRQNTKTQQLEPINDRQNRIGGSRLSHHTRAGSRASESVEALRDLSGAVRAVGIGPSKCQVYLRTDARGLFPSAALGRQHSPPKDLQLFRTWHGQGRADRATPIVGSARRVL